MSVSSKPWWQERVAVPNGKSLTNGAVKKWWQALGEPCSNVLLVKLTPELAEEFMKRNEKNRRFKDRIASAYAIEMSAGRWLCNGETIVFDVDGRMIQGQHRCAAVIRSGVTIMVYVVFDVDPISFVTMDSGSRRSASDQLGIAGHSNSSTLASTGLLVHRYTSGNMTSKVYQTNNSLCFDIIEKHPEIAASVEFVCANRFAKNKAKPSVMAAAHYFTNQIDRECAQEFWDRLLSGVGLEEGDPELTLTRKLDSLRSTGQRNTVPAFVEMHCFISAWNAKRDGKRISVIRLPNTWDSSAFPQFR